MQNCLRWMRMAKRLLRSGVKSPIRPFDCLFFFFSPSKVTLIAFSILWWHITSFSETDLIFLRMYVPPNLEWRPDRVRDCNLSLSTHLTALNLLLSYSFSSVVLSCFVWASPSAVWKPQSLSLLEIALQKFYFTAKDGRGGRNKEAVAWPGGGKGGGLVNFLKAGGVQYAERMMTKGTKRSLLILKLRFRSKS